MKKNGQVICCEIIIEFIMMFKLRKLEIDTTCYFIFFLKDWCQIHSEFSSKENFESNSSSSHGSTFASFTPHTIERIILCVTHISTALFGCGLCIPILIFAKNNASAARFKLVNNFIVYICLVSLIFSILQFGFGIR